MPAIKNEIIDRLGALQSQIWTTVGKAVSDASNQTIGFESPLTVGAKIADMLAEVAMPMMVIQFAFASQPENAQVVLLPQATVLELAGLLQGAPVEDVDENTVADLRAVLEAVVQGICLSVGAHRNEPTVASGLSIRFQVCNFPANIQRSDGVARVQVAVTGDDLNGGLIWLLDAETVQLVIGTPADGAEEEPTPFEAEAAGAARGSSGAGHPAHHPHEDPSGLELLMDIPLEISVELGRVRMLVRDVVELGTGSIIEIDKAAGEPVDVMVNGRLVARGEVVVIEDNFGVRITEIVNPYERLGRAGEAA